MLFILFLLSICCTNQLLAQSPCGAGQKFATITPTAGAANPNIGSIPLFNSVTVTKTDIVGATTATGVAGFASTYLGAAYIPTSTFIDGGGYTDYILDLGEETDVTYTFASPVTDPIIFLGYYGIDQHSTIEVVGKTITKVGGKPGFLASGSTISANADDQTGYVKVAGTHTSLTLKMKASTMSTVYQWFSLGIGACYTPPGDPCPAAGNKFKTATHWNSSAGGYFTAAQPGTAQMASGNSINIVKNDIAAPTAASATVGVKNGGDTYTNGTTQCFPNSLPANTAFVDGGGHMNVYTYLNGVTELTYTFCKPITDPYIFFGAYGLSAGEKVAFDKPIQIMDAEPDFSLVAPNTVGVVTSAIYQNGYVKMPGSITSFKMTITNGPTYNQVTSIMVAECAPALVSKPAGPALACTAPSALTSVDFTKTGAVPANAAFASAYNSTGTKGPFGLKAIDGTDVNNAKGAPVKMTITTANPNADLCGTFSADPAWAGISLYGQYQTTVVKKAGDGFSYTYKFNSPVKLKLRNITTNYGVVHNEILTFKANNGGAPVNVSATANGAGINEGIVMATPGNPNGTTIIGSDGGSFWEAWPDAEVTEITMEYKSNNGYVVDWRAETHELLICSAPCAAQPVAGCTSANERTEAFGFTSSSATMATSAKGVNTGTLVTTAGVPILAAAGSGASTMGECGDANKQLAVSSGGWVLLGAKANKTGEKITYTFSQPVTNPIVLVWGIYGTTKLDVAGVTTCLKPMRTWYGATVAAGLTPGTTDQTSITGTLGLIGIGYYQVPGTFTELTFDVQTGVYENWFYMSIGEGACLPPVENLTAATPTALTCTGAGKSLKTYDANFDRNISAYKTVSGKTYNPVITPTCPAVGYAVGPVMDVTVNDVTVDCSTNNGYYFGLYGYTSYPEGKLPASAGCSPGTAPFASAGGGAVYAYSGVGTQGTAPWTTPGNMKWTFTNEVVNPIIKVKYLSWTKLSFKDCSNNIIPIATIPGTMKGGLTASGSSLFNNPVPTDIYANQIPNEWSDGREGEGAVQLIGRFKEINIQVEKTAVWLDYWTITLSEQVCTDAPAPTVACDAVIPSCPAPSAGPNPPASSGNPVTVAAGFTKSGVYGATGSLMTGGKPIITTVVSTSEVLSANTDRATSTFNNAACYSVAPVGGGAITIKDIGGSNTTTISFGRAIANPLVYIKDLTRLQLDFGTTLDIDGNAVCCMKQISASNGFTTTGTKVADNNPTEVGSPTSALTPGCGLVQLVGTFSNILILTLLSSKIEIIFIEKRFH